MNYGKIFTIFCISCLIWISCFYINAIKVVENPVRHVHLAIGDESDSIVVSWSTLFPMNYSQVFFAEAIDRQKSQLNFKKAIGTQKKFVNGGALKATQYIHKVVLRNIKPGQRYVYTVQSLSGKRFEFTGMTTHSEAELRLCVYGDFGVQNARSMPFLLKDNQIKMYDAILHIGDLAYDMYEENGKRGDDFLNMIEPIASTMPYMTLPGNHENSYNFSDYKARFNMPTNGDGENMYYSFNAGPVHFVFISTEFYFYVQYGLFQISNMLQWLEKDLKIANQPENRKLRPWIVMAGHRPIYCTNDEFTNCGMGDVWLRYGIPYFGMWGLEELMFKNGVDLGIWAHEHSYERTFPVYNRILFSELPSNANNKTANFDKIYRNPRAPVHIITGAAGNRELTDPFYSKKLRPRWTAFHTSDYGYTRMTFHNSTHLTVNQVSVNQLGNIVDSFKIVQQRHGAFAN